MHKTCSSCSLWLLCIFIVTILVSCDQVNDCDCPDDVEEWSYSFQHLNKGVSGILSIEKNKAMTALIHEEYVDNNLVLTIWPPKDKPWPWPWPWPQPTPPWPFPWEQYAHVSDSLIAAAANAPLALIVEYPKDTTYMRDTVTIHIKIGTSTFSGKINLWETPYTKQEFFQFIKRHNVRYSWQWETVPVDLWNRLTDEYKFSKNSIGKNNLPEDVSFGQFILWEYGVTPSPYTPISEGQSAMNKFPWGLLACIVVTGTSDLLGPEATIATGTVNATILKAADEIKK